MFDEMVEGSMAVVGDLLAATTLDEVGADPRKKKPKIKRKKRNVVEGPPKKPLPIADGSHTALGVQWIDQLSVSAADDSHRDAGLWAFETYNPHAMRGASEHLALTRADFVMLQETRVPPVSVKDTESSTANAGWRMSLEGCGYGHGGGLFAGAAVACRNHVGMAVSCSDDIMPEVLRGRFKIRVVGAVVRGGINVCSCYFHSSLGIAAAPNMNILQAVAAVLSTIGGPWIIGADWNCTPEQLTKTGWLKMVKGQVFAPRVNTCNENVYDYFVVCDDLAPAVHSTVAVSDALCSPHKPARLYIKAGPRQMMVRQLKSIGKFEAKMPFGPEPCRFYPEINLLKQDAGTTNSDLCRVFTDRMEQELIGIYG
jgi:hypothetical protein